MPLLERDHAPAIHHQHDGEGPPLLLLHGWSRSGADFASLAARLAPHHRVIRPDLRGHGRSAPGRFTLDDLAGDLVALAEALDLRGVLVLGWSLGAQVALAAWPRLAGRVERLVLVGATPRFTEGPDWAHGLPARAVEGLALRLRRQPERTLARFLADCFTAGELDDAGRARVGALGAAPAPELGCALGGLALLAATDLRGGLPAVAAPTLLLHGDADAICPPGAALAPVGAAARGAARAAGRRRPRPLPLPGGRGGVADPRLRAGGLVNRVVKARVGAAFSRGAAAYDGSTAVQALVRARVLALAGEAAPGARELLDVGCGTGRLVADLLAARPGARATAVDLARGMCAAARAAAPAAAAGRRRRRGPALLPARASTWSSPAPRSSGSPAWSRRSPSAPACCAPAAGWCWPSSPSGRWSSCARPGAPPPGRRRGAAPPLLPGPGGGRGAAPPAGSPTSGWRRPSTSSTTPTRPPCSDPSSGSAPRAPPPARGGLGGRRATLEMLRAIPAPATVARTVSRRHGTWSTRSLHGSIAGSWQTPRPAPSSSPTPSASSSSSSGSPSAAWRRSSGPAWWAPPASRRSWWSSASCPAAPATRASSPCW